MYVNLLVSACPHSFEYFLNIAYSWNTHKILDGMYEDMYEDLQLVQSQK